MGGTIKYFLKKLLGHEYFRSMVARATKIFLKNLENPPTLLIHTDPPHTYVMYVPLDKTLFST